MSRTLSYLSAIEPSRSLVEAQCNLCLLMGLQVMQPAVAATTGGATAGVSNPSAPVYTSASVGAVPASSLAGTVQQPQIGGVSSAAGGTTVGLPTAQVRKVGIFMALPAVGGFDWTLAGG
jgi:hypothetical protein